MGWDKNDNKPAELVNFEAQYKTEEFNSFIVSLQELASSAANDAQRRGDSRIKSFAEFTNDLLANMTQKAGNVHFEQDKTVAERRNTLNACLEMLKTAANEYGGWHVAKYNMFEEVPGEKTFKKFSDFEKNINDELGRLNEYEHVQKAKEKEIRWKNHVNDFYKSHVVTVDSTALNSAISNADALYNFVNKYSEEYAHFNAFPRNSVKLLSNLGQSINSYKSTLKKISPYNDTEKEALDKFKAMRNAQTKGMDMAKQLDAILKMNLPFGFNDKLLSYVKGLQGDGVYRDLNNITQDSNDMILLLDNSEKTRSVLDLNSLPEINPDNIGELDLSMRYDAIDGLETLNYEQKSSGSEIDHEHYLSLVEDFENFTREKLTGQKGYNNSLDFDEDMDLLQARYGSTETISPINKEKLNKGNYYAKAASSRAETLISLQDNIKTYIGKIATTQRDLMKAGNTDMARSVGQFGVRFSRFYNAMAKDLETISKTGIRTKLSEMFDNDANEYITTINYGKYSAEYTKDKDERERIRDEKEAQEKIEAQKLEEEKRIKAELERKKAEEKTLKEEAERKEREQFQKETEALRLKQEEAYKAKKAEEDRLEAERQKIEAEEARQEKLRHEEYLKKEAQKAAEKKRLDEIRGKYIDIMDRRKSKLVYGDQGTSLKGRFLQDFRQAQYALLHSLPAESSLAQEVYIDITNIKDRLSSTSLDAGYFRSHDDADPTYQLKLHSKQMETLTAIRGVLAKLVKLVPELKDDYITLGSQEQLDSGQGALLKGLGIEKPEGSPRQILMDAGKSLTEIYHKAFNDGRYIYEQSYQIEAPGIGNIKAFENEDFSFDKFFGLAPSEPQVQQNAPKLNEEAPKAQMDDPANQDDVLKNFLTEKIAAALGTDPDPKQFEEYAEYFVTHGNDNNRNRIFSRNNGDIISQIKTAAANGEKIFVTLPDREYNTMDISEIVLKDDVPSLQIPKQEYDAMKLAVGEICKRINATGETKGDSDEFKEFKTKLNDITNNGIPRSTNEYFAALNDLAFKAFDYAYAKLDQSMNTRRDNRFTEASQILEIYRAVCSHEKPSADNMNMNMIASKYLKVQLTNDLNSNDPQTVEKAQNTLGNYLNFSKGVKELTESDVFKSKFNNMSSKQLEKFAHKHANDITKDINKEKQKLHVQQASI